MIVMLVVVREPSHVSVQAGRFLHHLLVGEEQLVM